MSLSVVIAAALAFQVSAPAASAPLPAKAVMEKAQATAAKEKKNVYVMFTASWCGWCKKHYAFMEANKDFYNKNFVVVHLDVLEQPEKKNLENEGGLGYMKQWKGEGAGLPFLAIVNPKGEFLGNSMFPQGDKQVNTGHPWADEEVAAYMKLVEKTVTHAKKDDLAKLKTNLLAQEGRKSG